MSNYGRLVGRLVQSVDYWTQAAMRRFVSDVDRRLVEQNITRAKLAKKLGTSPAYVTKVMRGDVNFTLETMTKLALAVGGRLQITIADRESSGEWNTPMVYEEVPVYRSAQTSHFEISVPGSIAEQPKFHYEAVELAA